MAWWIGPFPPRTTLSTACVSRTRSRSSESLRRVNFPTWLRIWVHHSVSSTDRSLGSPSASYGRLFSARGFPHSQVGILRDLPSASASSKITKDDITVLQWSNCAAWQSHPLWGPLVSTAQKVEESQLKSKIPRGKQKIYGRNNLFWGLFGYMLTVAGRPTPTSAFSIPAAEFRCWSDFLSIFRFPLNAEFTCIQKQAPHLTWYKYKFQDIGF